MKDAEIYFKGRFSNPAVDALVFQWGPILRWLYTWPSFPAFPAVRSQIHSLRLSQRCGCILYPKHTKSVFKWYHVNPSIEAPCSFSQRKEEHSAWAEPPSKASYQYKCSTTTSLISSGNAIKQFVFIAHYKKLGRNVSFQCFFSKLRNTYCNKSQQTKLDYNGFQEVTKF